MIARLSAVASLAVLIGSVAIGVVRAASAGPGPAGSPGRAHIVWRTPRFLQRVNRAAKPFGSPTPSGPRFTGSADFRTQSLAGGDLLPVWQFTVRSPRDGNSYGGTVIGRSPFEKPATSKINTQIVPLILRTHRIATNIDTGTMTITTEPGDTVTDPTVQDNACMTAPNNVPLTVVRQSPIFTPAPFVVGGTDVGTTQYIDAYLRSSFWNALGSKASDYHTLFDPIHVLGPIVIDVPANEGIAITDPELLAALGVSVCAPVQMIDYYWFDSYLRGTLLPGLPEVTPATFPIFLSYNATWTYGVDSFFNCCLPAWYSIAGYPISTQTFAVAMFDRTNLFGGSSTGHDVEILSQDIADWAADPYFEDITPPWGNTPGWAGCAFGVLAGAALTGVSLPPVTASNGFAYHLQELAFLQWFYGTPSTGVNGWFSSGGTFLTDAGPICP